MPQTGTAHLTTQGLCTALRRNPPTLYGLSVTTPETFQRWRHVYLRKTYLWCHNGQACLSIWGFLLCRVHREVPQRSTAVMPEVAASLSAWCRHRSALATPSSEMQQKVPNCQLQSRVCHGNNSLHSSGSTSTYVPEHLFRFFHIKLPGCKYSLLMHSDTVCMYTHV